MSKERKEEIFEGYDFDVMNDVMKFTSNITTIGPNIPKYYYYDLKGQEKVGIVPFNLRKRGVKQMLYYSIIYEE